MSELAAKLRELRKVLGFDSVTEHQGDDGERWFTDHDPVGDLDGAIYDLERFKADEVCIETIKRVQKKLAEFDKRSRLMVDA